MALRDLFRRAPLQESEIRIRELARERAQIGESYDILQERLAELELALEDVGWDRIGTDARQEFSRSGLDRITRLARLTYLKNPLLQRGVQVQASYVFGQGLSIHAKQPDVDAVVQAFWDDEKNKVELTSEIALLGKEVELAVSGNLFFVLFPNVATGRVRVRSVRLEEIRDIVSNPEDVQEPWYYRREWTTDVLNETSGLTSPEQRIAYYPDWRYTPAAKPASMGQWPILWESPIYHVKVGGFSGWKLGLSETYSALDWVRSYKESLEDDATRSRALARWVHKITTPGGKAAVAAAKAKLQTTYGNPGSSIETNPPPLTGSTFIGAQGVELQPMQISQAVLPADHAQPIMRMVAAGQGLPETFYGHASIGNHATAKTLDRPTELRFTLRRRLWTEVITSILQWVIDRVALAPRGTLSGTLALTDEGERVVVLADDPKTGEELDRHLDIEWPSILEHSATEQVAAIAQAATLGGFPNITLDQRTLVRMLLTALGEDDVDELLDQIVPEDQAPGVQAQQGEAFKEVLQELRTALVALAS